MLCENYWWDCSTWAQHPVNCDTCFFEVENLWEVDWSEYGNPSRCDIVLPSSYMESNGVVDCGYRWRDIYCWNGGDLMHYSWVWGTESPREADWYAHTSTDTRYCWWAHWHKVTNAPNSYLCTKWTSSSVTHSLGNYRRSCSYWGINSTCWACEGWTEEECWSAPTNTCPASWWCSRTEAWWTCTTYYLDSPASACTSKVSTCQSDWTWDKPPYDYSSCTSWCPSTKWCSAKSNWQSCTTYSTGTSNSCSSYSIVSTCNAWTWSPSPYTYSSCSVPSTNWWSCTEEIEFYPSWAPYSESAPEEWQEQNERCESDAVSMYQWQWSCHYENIRPQTPMCKCAKEVACQSCSAQWWCSTTAHWWTCITYSSSAPAWTCTSITSTCNNGRWSTTPYSYSSCTPWCAASGWCSAKSNWQSCTTYSTNSSYSCDDYKTTSMCNAWTWSPSPDTYSSCSVPSTKWWSCFLAWTQVHMADGTTKNIEDVEAGDMIMTYNIASQNVEYHRVLRPLVHENSNDELYELTINWDVLKVTEVHNFYITRDWFEENVENQCVNPYKWTMAKELQVWDKILMKDWSLAEIEDITHHSNYGTVYNLSIEDVHTYFVDKWYLVHNELNKAEFSIDEESPAGRDKS